MQDLERFFCLRFRNDDILNTEGGFYVRQILLHLCWGESAVYCIHLSTLTTLACV